MFTSFSSNYADHFYAQLAAIKCDMNLVLQADPYADAPLEEDTEEISKLVAGARDEFYHNRPWGREGEASFSALSGRYYSQFVDDVNTAMEERDKSLTEIYVSLQISVMENIVGRRRLIDMWQNTYQTNLDELRRTNQYKIQLAHEEQQLLSRSLRDRLIQGITQRRSRLLRDKEQLDIADSNALLLNPNQFSIGHPTSPGGPTSNRKTRHTRLRPGEQVEEVSTTTMMESKRKRKAGFEDNDSGSPAPVNRPTNLSSTTPFQDARAKQAYSQFEAPIYSIDRLFTEKELALNMNRAHVATSDFFTRLKENRLQAMNGHGQGGVTGSKGAGETADGATPFNGGPSNAVSALEGIEFDPDEPPPASPQPGSQGPQQVFHATRAAHRANPLSDLATTATVMPPYAINISAAASKANPSAPPLAGLSESEAVSDVQLMQRGSRDPMYETLMDRSCEQYGSMIDTTWWRAAAEDQARSDINGHAQVGLEGPLNAASLVMARQGSMCGVGGIAMTRTTSAAQSDMATGQVGKAGTSHESGSRIRR